MRRAALIAVRAVLLAGPAVLAFDQGGYFAGPRLVATIVAWVVLVIAAAAVPRVALDRSSVVGLAGLALLAGLTWLSESWAPLAEQAEASTERALLYLAATAAAALAFAGPRAAARAVEPILALGVLVVTTYGLSERLVPGLIDFENAVSAGGRFDQPLTYWNASGALAALGLVLAARVAGDRARPAAMRAAAAAAAAPLGLGVYLSFSRGALAALAVGLAVLLALTPAWAQVRAVAIALATGALAALAAALIPAVEDNRADAGQGALMLVVLLALAASAAALQAYAARAEGSETTATGPLPRAPQVRAAAWTAAVLAALAPFVLAATTGGAPSDGAFGATAERFGSGGTYRVDYWAAALRGFADDPALGAGAGSFGVTWLRERDTEEIVRDAHSLPLETLAELGLVGFAALLLALGGIALAARRVARDDPALAAGPIAALAAWLAHASIDWDWEMPALTLVAAVLAGLLLARAGPARPAPPPPAR